MEFFHLAAQTHPPTSFTDKIGTWEWNVMGSINLTTIIKDLQPSLNLYFVQLLKYMAIQVLKVRN